MKKLLITIILLTVFHLSCGSFIQQRLQSKNYNMSWSIQMDKYAAITHCNQTQIKTWNCLLCKKAQKPQNLTYVYNQQSKILAFMGYLPQKGVILISWRGTVDITNWIQDFSYYQINYPNCKNCKVHFGFLQSYLTVQDSLITNLRKLLDQYPNAQIVSVGSSLGAALATVCSLQLQLKTNRVKELHAFGCPRVGNQEYAKFLASKIDNVFRVVHNRDIVPHLPLPSQGYQHVPNQILFDEKMQNYVICDDSGEDPNCSNKYQPNYSIPDHVTYFYSPDLQNLCTV